MSTDIGQRMTERFERKRELRKTLPDRVTEILSRTEGPLDSEQIKRIADEIVSITDAPRLIRVNHDRCDEWVAYTYVLAPANWSSVDVRAAIDRAKKTYLDALDLAKTDDPEPPRIWQPQEFYKQHPDKTVREVEEMLAEKRAVHKDWEKRRTQTRRTFEDFLRDEGFVGLWEDDTNVSSFEVFWGHRHGTRIAYGETELDTLPRPIKIADPNFEDES